MLRDLRPDVPGARRPDHAHEGRAATSKPIIVVAALTATLGLTGLLSACSNSPPGANRGASATSRPAGGAGSVTTVTAAPETPTPGDIPDTIAYISYVNAAGGYQFVHPEGWAQTGQGTAVAFTDNYNTVSADVVSGTSAPTVATAQAQSVATLKRLHPAFQLVGVSQVTIPAGTGVRITYRTNSTPDPVTGRSVRIEVQRYEVLGKSRVVVMELSGAVGADNVDPYNRMVQSLQTQ